MRDSDVVMLPTPLTMVSEERRRLVIYAVVAAMAIHGLMIYLLLNRPSYKPLLLPKQSIEINLVASRPAAATPRAATPPAPKVRSVISPPPKPIPAKHSEIPIEKHVDRSEPITEPDFTPPVPEPVKQVDLPQPVPVETHQDESESESMPVETLHADTEPEPISPPAFDAAYLNNPRPVYPVAARRMGMEGVVILRVTVDPQGKPEDVIVVSSSGSSILDRSAVDIVFKQWVFVPARQGDHPISGVVDVPIRFSLR